MESDIMTGTIERLIMSRGLLLVVVSSALILVTLFLLIIKKRKKWIERILIFFLIATINCTFVDFIKLNFLTFKRNISENTVITLVEMVKTDESKFYGCFNSLVFGSYKFDDNFFHKSKSGELSVLKNNKNIEYPLTQTENFMELDENKEVPVHLLYDGKEIKIFQSEVWHKGSFMLLPINGSYYICSLYVLKGDELIELQMYSNTLLFFDIDKIIESVVG